MKHRMGAFAKPAPTFRAWPGPLRGKLLFTTRAPKELAMVGVESVEPSSTTISSKLTLRLWVSASRQAGSVDSPLYTGTITLIWGSAELGFIAPGASLDLTA